jgi:predicted glycogen debranching enzyme
LADGKAREREWLETDGFGGFASGTVDLVRTRRYHALLLAATSPPTGRFVLVNGFEAWARTPAGRFPITRQLYGGDVLSPDGAVRIVRFSEDPWPRWTFRLEDGTTIEQEIFAARDPQATVLLWRTPKNVSGMSLEVRPLLSGRDYHALHHENPDFRFGPSGGGEVLIWHPYDGVPPIAIQSNGEYTPEPLWYRNFLYTEDRSRGLEAFEDLASPGFYKLDLSLGEGALILRSAETEEPRSPTLPAVAAMRRAEAKRRRSFSTRLERAADGYIVRKGTGKTVVAGYPWFADWGRDTFISLRGLCLATGRLDDARQILLEWSGAVSQGMLPNRFPDRGEEPEYNSVDASLWYIVAVHECLSASDRAKVRVPAGDRQKLLWAVRAILEGYAGGTRYGIRADRDGLLAAGIPGVQLTWMDSKIGDWVVTPRMGKPVEVQALWVNALEIGAAASAQWSELALKARSAFHERFWNEAGGFLYDVVDADHVTGAVDARFRPNQIFAVGGLPSVLVEGEKARRVLDEVERRLWTPAGLRSLAPEDPAYVGRYLGGMTARDAAYHQGTVWPWLAGAFVDGWVRVRGRTRAARREAREKFFAPLLRGLGDAGLGHISEIADGDPPHAARGCPFQAWSVAEAVYLDRVVLAED